MEELIIWLERKIELCDELGNMESEKVCFIGTLKKVRSLAINFTDSSLQLKENHIPAFVEWYLNNGYMHTERPNVYKNGLNIILRDDLYSKYLQEIKVNL